MDFSQWVKLVPLSQKSKIERISVLDFKNKEWFAEGLFGDLVEDDDGSMFALAQSGKARLRIPEWNNELCVSCNLCVNNCPQRAITEKYEVQESKCIGCGICSAVCPKKLGL